jgi:hypothetical protein
MHWPHRNKGFWAFPNLVPLITGGIGPLAKWTVRKPQNTSRLLTGTGPKGPLQDRRNTALSLGVVSSLLEEPQTGSEIRPALVEALSTMM